MDDTAYITGMNTNAATSPFDTVAQFIETTLDDIANGYDYENRRYTHSGHDRQAASRLTRELAPLAATAEDMEDYEALQAIAVLDLVTEMPFNGWNLSGLIPALATIANR